MTMFIVLNKINLSSISATTKTVKYIPGESLHILHLKGQTQDHNHISHNIVCLKREKATKTEWPRLLHDM